MVRGLAVDFQHRGPKAHKGIPEDIDARLSWDIIGCGLRVHTKLGAGLLEAVYEECLCHEFSRSGLRFRRQVESPIRYDGVVLATRLRVDLLVEDRVIVEVKSVEQILKVHEAQLLTYLRLTGIRLGLLINFNTAHLRDGIRRRVI
jgi:GxxExxY protein